VSGGAEDEDAVHGEARMGRVWCGGCQRDRETERQRDREDVLYGVVCSQRVRTTHE
jgi:hypothetical protein